MAKNIDSTLNDMDKKLDEMSDAIHSIDREVIRQRTSFEEHTKQDEKNAVNLYEELKRMNDVLQVNTDSLKEHMYRTELLEKLVNKMDARLEPLEQDKIEQEAIKKYTHHRVMKFAKVAAGLAAAISIIMAFKPIWIKLFL